MIILIDNKNYMIRYCQDEPDIHGFDTSFPNWQGYMKLLSDMGDTVVVSGKEAEDYLDANHIYYVHIENRAKESFATFLKRLERTVEENKEFVDMNLSNYKLLFGIAEGYEKATVHTDNIFAIWKSLEEEDSYFMEINVDDNISPRCLTALLKLFLNDAREWYGYHSSKAADYINLSKLLFEDVSVVSGCSVEDLLRQLEVMIFILEQRY